MWALGNQHLFATVAASGGRVTTILPPSQPVSDEQVQWGKTDWLNNCMIHLIAVIHLTTMAQKLVKLGVSHLAAAFS